VTGRQAKAADSRSLIPVERIERAILLIRGHKVMLSNDLSALYGVEPRALVQAVKRNSERFPDDFVFQLSKEEFDDLKSQNVISSAQGWGGRRATPYAFTEHGAIMAASVLNTPRAIDASVYVIRTFVKLRELLSTHKELAGKLAELERKVGSHDVAIQSLVTAIRRLMEPSPAPPHPRIGFHTTKADKA
jgi:hypothetical protein